MGVDHRSPGGTGQGVRSREKHNVRQGWVIRVGCREFQALIYTLCIFLLKAELGEYGLLC